MIVKRMFKFPLSALLLAASVSAYAQGDGGVQLNNTEKEVVDWKTFADVINGKTTISVKVDSTKLHTARVEYLGENGKGDTEGAKFEATQAAQAVVDAQKAYDDAKHNQDSWTAQIASLQADRSTLQEERNTLQTVTIPGLQSNLKTKQEELAAKLATLKSPIESQLKTKQGELAAKEAEIKDKENEIKALQAAIDNGTGGATMTAPWLTKVREDAEIFGGRFKITVDNDFADKSVMVYYKLETEEIEDESLYTLYISFVPHLNWESKEAKALFDNIKTEVGNKATTFIENVEVYLDPSYGSNGTLTISTCRLSAVAKNVYSSIENINENAYQVPDTSANQEKLDAAKAEESILESERDALAEEISDLQGQIEDIDNNVPENEAVTALLNAISGLETQINEKNNLITGENGYNDQIADLTSQINTIQGNLKKLTDKDANGKTGLDLLKDAVDDAKDTLTTANADAETAKNAFETELDAYDKLVDEKKADALIPYQDITLIGDVTANDAITADFTGRIRGNGKVITYTGEGYLFSSITAVTGNTNSGIISNLAVNGNLVEIQTNVKYSDVVVWNGVNGIYRDDNGGRTTYNTLAELGYALRDDQKFGVNFNTLKLVQLTDAPSKVFSLTVYDPISAPVQSYVQTAKKGSTDLVTLKNNAVASYAVPVNRFAKSADENVAGLGLTNVFYGGNNICENAAIEDKVDFYCPEEIIVDNVEFDRAFTSGYNTVCLPFTLSYGCSSDISAICEYDRVSDKFWFTKINETNTLPANTPALLILSEASNGKTFNISNVTIGKTAANQIVDGGGKDIANSKSYGTYKQVNSGQFVGESQSACIYGLNSKGNFQAAGSEAKFPAFRMVVWTNDAVSNLKSLGSRYLDEKPIGILDENGVEITGELTGINGIVADAASFEVAGGQGEILFSSEVDFGKVAIYSIDGKVVAVADVYAGTSSVSVQKGLYIVNGKKVLVK